MESNGNLPGRRGGVATLERPAVDLSHVELRQMYELMVLSRMLDERMVLMNRAGRAAFQISCQGHEGVTGIAFALDPARDWLVPYYRDLPAVLRFGMTPREVLMSLLAKQGEPNSNVARCPPTMAPAGSASSRLAARSARKSPRRPASR